MANVGVLTAIFRLDTKEAEASAKKLERTLKGELKGSLEDLTRSAGPAGRMVGALGPAGLAAAAGIGAAALGIRELVREGDRISNLSRQFRMTAEEVQRLEAGGRGLGISFEKLGGESAFLEKTIGGRGAGVVKALNELGLSYGVLASMRADERLIAVHEALARVQDPLRQSALGAELLGKGFEKMSAVDLADFKRDAEGAVTLSQRAVDAGDALGDSWDRLRANSKALALEGLAPLAEKLADILDSANELSKTGAPTWLKTLWNVSVPGALFNASVAMTGLGGGGRPGGGIMGPPKPIPPPGPSEADLRAIAEESRKADAAAKKAWDEALGRASAYWTNLREEAERFREDLSFFPAESIDVSKLNVPFLPGAFGDLVTNDARGRFAGTNLGGFGPTIVDFRKNLEKSDASLSDLNSELANLAHLSEVIGPQMASIFQGLSAGIAGFQGISAGLGSIGKGGFLNTLTGIGGIAGGIGAIVGPLIGLLSGIGGPNIGRDVRRDIGATSISDELKRSIEDSGKNPQLFLREIFAEGNMSPARLAEEVGDLFSMLQRGEISEGTLLQEMKEALPLLIEHFQELGPVGQENVERILGAAREMGVELGAAGDALERLQAGIPETTLEGMANQLGISVEKARELAELMGVPMQTDLERLADDLDIPVDKLQELGDKMREKFGTDIMDIDSVLQSMGVTIEQLAEKLGVELPAAAASAEDAIPTEGGTIDPKVLGDATGIAIAERLAPGQKEMSGSMASMAAVMHSLPDAIARAIRDAGLRAVTP